MLLQGNCLTQLQNLEANSVDSIVTDPPYGLGFMGKEWDSLPPGQEVFEQCLRVLKPGGHLLCFGGSRTYHRMAVAVEDAGFDIRDQIMWVYGSGFPKSQDISKSVDALDKKEAQKERRYNFTAWFTENCKLTKSELDKVCGTNTMGRHWTDRPPNGKQPDIPVRRHFELLRPYLYSTPPDWIERLVDERTVESENFKKREVVAEKRQRANNTSNSNAAMNASAGATEKVTNPATTPAQQWGGYGTALKPAFENILMARKPLETCSDFERYFVYLVKKIKSELCQYPKIAETAGKVLQSSQDGQTLNIAHWTALENINIQGDLFVLMATLQSEAKDNTNLSTVLEWLNILDVLYELTSIFTTSTELNMTTELRILNSLEWASILKNIMHPNQTGKDGQTATVNNAEAIFTGVKLKLNDIQQRFAQDHAILNTKEVRPQAEHAVMARKPIEKGLSIAQNCLKWGVGAINVDGCRVGTNDKFSVPQSNPKNRTGAVGKAWQAPSTVKRNKQAQKESIKRTQEQGRFPANFIHDGSPEVVGLFPVTKSGALQPHHNGGNLESGSNTYGKFYRRTVGEKCGNTSFGGDTGSAARFFYSPKAKKKERLTFNNHPTVKPVSLMQYLVRLITPAGGTCLDPFAGSGTTGLACMKEGCHYILIDADSQSLDIARRRLLSEIASQEWPMRNYKLI